MVSGNYYSGYNPPKASWTPSSVRGSGGACGAYGGYGVRGGYGVSGGYGSSGAGPAKGLKEIYDTYMDLLDNYNNASSEVYHYKKQLTYANQNNAYVGDINAIKDSIDRWQQRMTEAKEKCDAYKSEHQSEIEQYLEQYHNNYLR